MSKLNKIKQYANSSAAADLTFSILTVLGFGTLACFITNVAIDLLQVGNY